MLSCSLFLIVMLQLLIGRADLQDGLAKAPSLGVPSHSYVGVWALHKSALTHAKSELIADPNTKTSFVQMIEAISNHSQRDELVYPTADGQSVLQWHLPTDKSLRIWPAWTDPNQSSLRKEVSAVKMIGSSMVLIKEKDCWMLFRAHLPEPALLIQEVPDQTLRHGPASYEDSQLQCGFKIAATSHTLAAAIDQHAVRYGTIHWKEEPTIQWTGELRVVQAIDQVLISANPPFVGVVAGGILRIFSLEGKPKGTIEDVGTVLLPDNPAVILSCKNFAWTCIKCTVIFKPLPLLIRPLR